MHGRAGGTAEAFSGTPMVRGGCEGRVHHHDVGSLSLVQLHLPQRLPVVGGVLLVGLLVGGNDAPAPACRPGDTPISPQERRPAQVGGKYVQDERWRRESSLIASGSKHRTPFMIC